MRIKSRLKLEHLSDSEVINHCLKLIELSYDIHETNDLEYIRINCKNLYFVISKRDSLVLTLSPIKPERLLALLED